MTDDLVAEDISAGFDRVPLAIKADPAVALSLGGHTRVGDGGLRLLSVHLLALGKGEAKR